MNDNDGGADFLQGLTFTPGWAKAPADRQRFDAPQAAPRNDDADERNRRGRRDGGRDRNGSGVRWGEREGAGDALRRPRPPVRPFAADAPMDRPRQPFVRAPEGASDRGPGPRPPYPSQYPRDSRPGPRMAPPPEPIDYPVEVRFLPDPKALAVVVHKVARGHRAFPIRDLARLFLDNPASCEVRIDIKPGQEGLAFHQCSRCGWLALTEAELREHAFAAHFEEEFSSETVEGEPPTGTFVCVARCGVTGKLLAPPNHHSYNQRVQEMLRTECRNMPEDQYRSRIEVMHDAELVQKWREASRQRTVYRRKAKEGEPGAPMERSEADALFSREVLPALMTTPKHAACSHAVAMQLRDRMLSSAAQDAWRRELRYPASLFFALRGAFRHKRMHVFRAGEGKGIDFVMSRVPLPLDVQHAVPELKAIADHLTTRPGCTRSELLTDLGVPPDGPQTPEQERIVQQLKWVTDRGHVIEYFNGVLALPEEHPVFRFVQVHPPTQPQPRPAQRTQATEHSSAAVPNASQPTEPNAAESVVTNLGISEELHADAPDSDPEPLADVPDPEPPPSVTPTEQPIEQSLGADVPDPTDPRPDTAPGTASPEA